MSQHRPLLPTQDINPDCPEPDDARNDETDYTIQTAQDLLKRKTFQKKLTICMCVFLLVFIVAAAVAEGVLFNVANLVQKGHGGLEGLAYSKILDYINTSYDPCEDFYNFSCGGWYNSKPADISTWGTSVELIMENYNSIAGYLSQPPSSDDPDALNKTKYAYSACTDTDYIQDHYAEEIKNFMVNRGGGWDKGDFTPSKPWSINESLYKDHLLGSVALFSFAIEPDDLNSSKPVIRIYQAGLTLGSPEDYFEPDFNLAFIIEYTLNKINPDGYYHTLAQDIGDFERMLAQYWLTKTELRNASATYNPMTLNELTGIFAIDWISYFNNYFEEAGYNWSFSGSTVVIVDTPSYFRAVNSFFRNNLLEDYAKWQLLISTYVIYTSSLPIGGSWMTSLRSLRFPNTVRLVNATTLSCIEHLERSMPLAVARPFVEEFIVNSTQLKVGKMAEGLKDAFKERILKKDWLDEVTKQRSIEKVNAITEQIAYPSFIEIDKELDDVYSDLNIPKGVDYFRVVSAMQEFTVRKMLSNYFHTTDKTEWLDPPTKVNAYYSPQFNQFVVLAGILRPPFFSPDWFQFLIYGALGTVVGHELTHGFDDQGQKYNKDGNRVKWWTDSSIENFDRRTKCFVDQYNNYSLQGFKINGQLTLGENIADNGGIHTSFRAFKNAMNGTTELDIMGYTGDQLFFVAFAQLWCSSFSEDTLKTRINSDPHSPGPIRVQGSLVNSEDFSNAFKCPLGSAMYPSKDRCELW